MEWNRSSLSRMRTAVRDGLQTVADPIHNVLVSGQFNVVRYVYSRFTYLLLYSGARWAMFLLRPHRRLWPMIQTVERLRLFWSAIAKKLNFLAGDERIAMSSPKPSHSRSAGLDFRRIGSPSPCLPNVSRSATGCTPDEVRGGRGGHIHPTPLHFYHKLFLTLMQIWWVFTIYEGKEKI